MLSRAFRSFLILSRKWSHHFWFSKQSGRDCRNSQNTLLAKYNDLDNVSALIEANKVKSRPSSWNRLPGTLGCISPNKGFLEALRRIVYSQAESCLIFDEVMTDSVLPEVGHRNSLNINADIICFGKVIGGGLPQALLRPETKSSIIWRHRGRCIKQELCREIALAMAAGLAMLQALDNDREIFKRLEEKNSLLAAGIDKVLKANQVDFTINRVGSMISVHFDANPVFDFQTAAKGDNETFEKILPRIVERRNLYCAIGLRDSGSSPMRLLYEDLDFTIQAIDKVSKNF